MIFLIEFLMLFHFHHLLPPLSGINCWRWRRWRICFSFSHRFAQLLSTGSLLSILVFFYSFGKEKDGEGKESQYERKVEREAMAKPVSPTVFWPQPVICIRELWPTVGENIASRHKVKDKESWNPKMKKPSQHFVFYISCDNGFLHTLGIKGFVFLCVASLRVVPA